MVNVDDMSKESLKKFYERKFGKDLKIEEKKKKEDYTVNRFKKIEFEPCNRNLLFGNGCQINSNYDGDGVTVDNMFVQAIIKRGHYFRILLKGIEEEWYDDDEILYECDE